MNIQVIIAAALLCALTAVTEAQTDDKAPRLFHPTPGEKTTKVVVSGNIADDTTRSAILEKLEELYGARNIVDKTSVGGVNPPPQWHKNIDKLLSNDIKQIQNGQITVVGTQITLKGKIANKMQHQRLSTAIAASLEPNYKIINTLTFSASPQDLLDTALSNRIVEFESGSSHLTITGQTTLDDIASAIKNINPKNIQIIGHTDDIGSRQANIELSLARAYTVRSYLSKKGIPATTLTAIGAGPDYALRSNDTPQGRAQNRRIEFRILE